jgi:hypothetical protein
MSVVLCVWGGGGVSQNLFPSAEDDYNRSQSCYQMKWWRRYYIKSIISREGGVVRVCKFFNPDSGTASYKSDLAGKNYCFRHDFSVNTAPHIDCETGPHNTQPLY